MLNCGLPPVSKVIKPPTEISDGFDGVGYLPLWGGTPAIIMHKAEQIFLAGLGDLGSLWRTAAHRWQDQNLNFYIQEDHPASLARALVLLTICWDAKLKISTRVEYYLSFYGNLRVSQPAYEYLQEVLLSLAGWIQGDPWNHPVTEVVLLDSLKFGDRDRLVEQLRVWQQAKAMGLDLVELRDHRKRGHYRDRYDFAENLLDANYHNVLGPATQRRIQAREHRRFGNTGQSFETGLHTYQHPNFTLLSYLGVETQRGPKEVLGYWGDLLNSPFVCLSCPPQEHPDHSRVMAVRNEQPVMTAAEICRFNLSAWLYQLSWGKLVRLSPEEEDFPGEAAPALFVDGGDPPNGLPFFPGKISLMSLAIDHALRKVGGLDFVVVGCHSSCLVKEPLWEKACTHYCAFWVESLKYQCQLNVRLKFNYRCALHQAGEQGVWEPLFAKVSPEEADKEYQLRDKENQASDFLRFRPKAT